VLRLEPGLARAGRHGGPARHAELALSHALVSARDLVRSDGGTFQVADYDAGGALLSRGTYQGASDASTWARGQAWAMIGFTAAYRATRDPRTLDAARKVTAYWLARAPADGVPRWDFDAPVDVKDTSAAAAAASALLALAALVDGEEAARYRDAALRALDALTSEAWIDTTAGEALLRGGVGNGRTGQDVGVGLVYGDHYLLEAVLRAFPDPGPCEAAVVEPPVPPAEPTPPAAPGGGSRGGCTTAETGSTLAIAAAILALARRRS
jgi:unsaturated chondroitin disaccharide hydrolase